MRRGPHVDTETGAHQGNNLTHNENSFMHASQEGRENANIDAGWGFIWRISAYINTVTRVLVSSDRVAAMIVASPSVVTIEALHGRPIAVSDKGDRDPD
jgi:hypothetical protein